MPNRISGVISGMDIDGLINASLEVQRQPMTKLNDQMNFQNMKKEVLDEQIKNLQKLKDKTLKLKLESTFKNKTLNSSDESIATGSATMTAVKGSYSLKVNNLAVPARVQSTYARATILNSPPNTMNLQSIAGRPSTNFEGKVDLAVTTAGANYIASAIYKKDGGGQMGKFETSVIESATVDGTIGSTITSANSDLNMTVNGRTFSINLEYAAANQTSLKSVAADMEKKINDYLNTQEGTTDVAFVMIKAEAINGTGNEKIAFYNLNDNSSTGITFNSGNAKALLGLNSPNFTSVTQMSDKWIDASLTTLRTKMNDSTTGVLPGVSMVAKTGEQMTVGTSTLRVNSQLRTLDRIYPSITGGSDVADTNIDLNQTLESVGFNNGSLEYASDKSGFFTINGVKVKIGDMTTATVNDVLSIINTSGAGVTASYDSTNDRFILAANENYYNTTITLGDAGDTTNFLALSKISIANGGTLNPGTAAATIDPDSFIKDGGFSESPTSGTFSINGVSLYVDVTKDTLNDLIKRINTSNAGVIANYDTNSDKFVLKADPNSVDTNLEKIELGGTYDSSNLLQVLNLAYNESSITGQALSGNRSSDTVVFSKGTGSEATITIPATIGSGAYNSTPLALSWNDGIAAGAQFTVNTDGITNSYTWTNNSGSAITNIDSFISAWNTNANWSSGTIQVAAIKEGTNQIRFVNRTQGANSDFTITEVTPGDAAELGFVSGTQVTNGAGATATAEYNALNFALYMMNNTTVKANALVTTDGQGGITVNSTTEGTQSLFIMTDEASQASNTIRDYFGELAVKSSLKKGTGNLGNDAEFTVDGVFYTRTSNKVDDVIGGVELNLMSTSSTAVTITIDNKTDDAVNAIADFILEYNKLLDILNPPTISTEDRKYLTPLTQEKLDSMKTATEVEDYQSKFKKFSSYKILREESSIRNMYDFLRSEPNKPQLNADPDYDILVNLNITAGSVGGFEDSKKGYLIKQFDPEKQTEEEYKAEIVEELKRNYKFMDVLKKDEDKIFTFFGKSSEVAGEQGLARRIEGKVNDYILTGGFLKEQTKVNGYIDKRLRTMYEQYQQYEERMTKREETLRNKYNAMEQNLARLQEQSNQVAQKLGISTE